MNIFVCVKQVPDTETKVQPNGDGTFIETSSIKWIMNPYDEFAVEQALLVKAANAGSTVTVVRVGSVKDTEALRTAMAMGADEAILVEADDNLDSYSIAKAIKGGIEKSGKDVGLVLCGKQAIDDDCNQTGQLLASMLDLPQATFASEIEFDGDSHLIVTREIDAGLQKVRVSIPSVLTCDLRLNVPRFAKIQDISKAKKKKIDTINLSDLDIDVEPRLKTSKVASPETREGGVMVESVDELIDKLKNEAKVL